MYKSWKTNLRSKAKVTQIMNTIIVWYWSDIWLVLISLIKKINKVNYLNKD